MSIISFEATVTLDGAKRASLPALNGHNFRLNGEFFPGYMTVKSASLLDHGETGEVQYHVLIWDEDEHNFLPGLNFEIHQIPFLLGHGTIRHVFAVRVD